MSKPLVTEIAYFPPISMIATAKTSGTWYLEAFENYQKGSFRNRCYLLGHQGPISLSVPLRKGKNQQQSIRDVKISYDEDWPTQHLRTIKAAYGSSAFILYYAEALHQIIRREHIYLFDLCLETTEFLLQSINVKVDLKLTSNWKPEYHDIAIDYRNHFLPKSECTDQESYIEKRLLNYSQVFPSNFPNVKLSGLDMLLNCGPEAVYVMRDDQ